MGEQPIHSCALQGFTWVSIRSSSSMGHGWDKCVSIDGLFCHALICCAMFAAVRSGTYRKAEIMKSHICTDCFCSCWLGACAFFKSNTSNARVSCEAWCYLHRGRPLFNSEMSLVEGHWTVNCMHVCDKK